MEGRSDELAMRFHFNEGLLDMLTEGFTPEDWRHRAGEANHALWLLGHVSVSRRFLRRLLGEQLPPVPWEAHFARGSRPGPAADAVEAAVLYEDFRESGRAIAGALRAMDPEAARAPVKAAFPDGSETVLGAADFLHFHETYHLGQLGLLRRVLGRPGIP
ncbi:MAG: DinB family protein [Planctomycetes bacterium]|nr:DinB family protein [Planctomycetota bacterium]